MLKSSLTVAYDFPGPITNYPLLHIATSEITSFCIDSRLCQMAFFVFAKVSKGPAKAGFRVM